MSGNEKFELIHFGNAQALAESAAREWIEDLQRASTAKPYCVALSGGRIARQFFTALREIVSKTMAEKVKERPLDLVEFFWGDERCVSPEDSESNFGMAQESLLGPLGIASQRAHRVRGELPPEEGARQAADEICRMCSVNAEGQPVLDVIFLGMGEDGHVASLFPEETEQARSSKAVYRAVVSLAKPPPHRITLGYPAIAAARQVWVLSSGSGKEGALRASLEPGGQTPLARVFKSRDFTRVFTDVVVK